MTGSIYQSSLALLTDLYQLTMASAQFKSGIHSRQAVFHLFYRKNPFQGGYAVFCGLQDVLEYLDNFHFSVDDIDYLRTLQGYDGSPLFDEPFLEYLQNLELSLNIDAIPEGRIVFPFEPLIRVEGPLLECQILETALLNILNFQTLIATKASRICSAAQGDPVLEFGLRRAQGIGASVSASRAAYIGGCAATSNVIAGKLYDIPVKGTHAHSWVLSFDSELEAFREYARAMPNNCILLVDTFDTLQGVKNAIEVGRELKAQNKKLLGIRLDSGDLAYLSQEARKLLDEAGFEDCKIVASNDLDENIIESLKNQDSQIAVWGVGTRLVTAWDQPALGGVYKLSALEDSQGKMQEKLKISEQRIKMNQPGVLQVRRFFNARTQEFIGDMIFDDRDEKSLKLKMLDPLDETRQKKFKSSQSYEDLLIRVVESGKVVCEQEELLVPRQRLQDDLKRFHSGVLRFLYPHQYPVGIEVGVFELKKKMILEKRGDSS